MDKQHASIPFPSAQDFQDHLVSIHSESFTALDASILAEQRARPRISLFTTCPLCGEVPNGLPGNGAQQDNVSELLEIHIKEHLEYLALRSLPWREDGEAELSGSASLEIDMKNPNDLPSSPREDELSDNKHSWSEDDVQGVEGRPSQDDSPDDDDDSLWEDNWEDDMDTTRPTAPPLRAEGLQQSTSLQSGSKDIRRPHSSVRIPRPMVLSPSRADRAGRSRREHSPMDASILLESEGSRSVPEMAINAETWPPPSFLFTINELPINDEPSEGGEAPRINEHGFWFPPIRSNGFAQQVPSRIYRYEDGRISSANDCQWFNSQWWSAAGDELTEYRASTIFWCNNFFQFMVATGDASARHMDESPDPQNRWWPLTFRHEGSLSRVEEIGQESRLAGSGPWINSLGLSSYRNRKTCPAGGLAGNLAIVIGLIAFSCESEDLHDVLLRDRAWRGARWHGHNRGDGRKSYIDIPTF